MEFFFHPRGIALVGATANPAKGGFSILHNLRQGYTGRIYPVNPRYREIDGLPCYASVAEVPDPVDLAIVFVPAAAVAPAVQACAQRGIPGVMVQSAGFAETGPDGRRMQAELHELAARRKIRIWGPNCMGLVDAHRRFVFSFVSPVIWEEGLLPGSVSLVVQSGLLSAGFLIDGMTHGAMRVSKACSIGNKLDVDECDILAYLLDDPETAAIALYLESIADGRRLLRLLRRSTKPIVVLKGGQSRRGARAAMSHTASMAGDGAVVSGALAQAGVVEATDFGQMMELAGTLACYPQARFSHPPRVGVMAYSGAAGIVSADFIDRYGLTLAELGPVTLARIGGLFPAWMPAANPVDMWPAIEANGPDRVYRGVLEALCEDTEVDLVVMHVFVGGKMESADMAALAATAHRSKKPLVCWLLGAREQVLQFRRQAQELGIPVYRDIGRSIECLAAFKRVAPAAASADSPAVGAGPKTVPGLGRLLPTAGGVLDENRSKRILAAAGIPVVKERVANSVTEALTAAEQIGYPVVLKGLAADTIHKSEAGLVRLGIASAAQLEQSVAEMSGLAAAPEAYLVQRQVAGGVELIAGLIRDPQFGPCVMCGVGGLMAEAIGDRVFAAAPLTVAEAVALIGRLKTRKLLAGWRGQAPVDLTALAEVLVRLGALGCASDCIREIDVNPLIIVDGRPIAVDATVIVDHVRGD